MIDTLLITYETVETILYATLFLLIVGIAVRAADLSKKNPKKKVPENQKGPIGKKSPLDK